MSSPAQSPALRSVMEWRVAVIAGLVAGTVFLVLNLLFATLYYQVSAWTVFRYAASIVMGPGVLPPPASFDAATLVVGLGVNYLLALVYAVILAFIIPRWGLIVGIVGGALYGAALYFINLYTLTLLVPWLFAVNSMPLLISHVVFGAVAGGVYELFDVDVPGGV